MRIVIFANGDFEAPPELNALLNSADAIFAADGGARHLAKLKRRPDVVIGDLDSLSKQKVTALKKEGAHVLDFPEDKDQTDLELALQHAVRVGAEEIFVLGALGGRWDHSLANLLLAAHPALAGIPLVFLHGAEQAFLIRDAVRLDAPLGTRVSLIPVGGDAKGVSTAGLEFPLENETLAFGATRGVSNVINEADAEIALRKGLLLCLLSPPEME